MYVYYKYNKNNINQFADDLMIWEFGADINQLDKQKQRLNKLYKPIDTLNLPFESNKSMRLVLREKNLENKPNIILNNVNVKKKMKLIFGYYFR